MVKFDGISRHKFYPRNKHGAMVSLLGLLYLLDIVERDYMMWPLCADDYIDTKVGDVTYGR